MTISKDSESQSNVGFCAFALTDCVVHVNPQAAKYLRAVHRTALELAIPNLFGFEIGGYWLATTQIEQLRKLPECYPANEGDLVRTAIEAFLAAQLESIQIPRALAHSAKAGKFCFANHWSKAKAI